MKSFWIALAGLLLAGCSDKGDPIVARVGDRVITAHEFLERYRAYLSEVTQRDNIILRQKILTNMVNEKLILRDIGYQGFDRDDAYRSRMEGIRNEALLDRYARRVSTDTMNISEQELWNEFRAFNSKASARYLYAKTEAGAWKLKEQIAREATFEQLARAVFEDPGLANNGGYLGSFGWGEMEPALDEAVFSLPIGTVSNPIKLSVGYAIVKVETRVANPLASEGDYLKNVDKLARAVQDRKAVRLMTEETRRVTRELAPAYNEGALATIFKLWNTMPPSLSLAANIELPALGTTTEISGLPLVRFTDRSWTVGEFSKRLSRTTEKQRRRVKAVEDLKDIILGLATREVLLERAQAAGLGKDTTVNNQMQSGRLAYLLKRWGESVTDTVGASGWSDALVKLKYEQKKSEYVYPPEVNVTEILVRTREEATMLLEKVKQGADFGELAREHSIRIWAAKRGGELGFGTRSGYGILADKIFSASINQVLGPEHIDPYYGLFKILARKEGRPKTVAEAREEIEKGLASEKKQAVSRVAVDQLRAGVSIDIDNEALANIVINQEPS